MSDTSRARPLAETLAAMAALTPAQHALLERISHHATPVTVAELAQEAGLHVARPSRACSPLASWKSSSFPHPVVADPRWAIRR